MHSGYSEQSGGHLQRGEWTRACGEQEKEVSINQEMHDWTLLELYEALLEFIKCLMLLNDEAL